MRKFIFVTLAALGLAWVSSAEGQVGGYARPKSSSTPAISPFLNLARGGSPAVNYYGLVRPQTQTAKSLQSLQFQISGLAQPGVQSTPETGQPVLTTGHGATFFNLSHYYPSSPMGTGRSAAATGANIPR